MLQYICKSVLLTKLFGIFIILQFNDVSEHVSKPNVSFIIYVLSLATVCDTNSYNSLGM